MYLFAKSMALLWTTAEILILAAVWWGHRLSVDRGARFRGPAVTAAILTVLFGAVLFFGESLLGRLVDLRPSLSRALFRWALWNVFCTLWVVLEGCIMIYVCRIRRYLARQKTRVPSPDRAGSRWKAWNVPLLVLGFFGLFAAYQAGLFHAVDRFDLNVREVVRISTFYIRICGVFWILFEWVVAIEGIRTYRLLNSGEGG